MEFEGCADFMNCNFQQVANFYGATFNNGAIFSSATFRGDAKFISCTFSGPTVVGDSLSGDPSLSETEISYSEGVINNVSLLLSSVTCKGDLQLDKAESDSSILIRDSELSGDMEMENFKNPSPDDITLFIINTEKLSGYIENVGGVYFDLKSSVLGDIDVRSHDESKNDLNSFNFREVIFDGFDFGKYKSLFRNQGWSLYGSSPPSPSEQENAYLRAKNGALDVGETDAAREFHYREMLNRGRSYLEKAISTDQRLYSLPRRFLNSLYFFQRWIVNQIFRSTCGYGERTSRVFLSSSLIVLFFAVVFYILSGGNSYTDFLRNLSFSFQSFTALILGTPPSDSLLVSVIVSFEAFLGPFFIALFVFTITQSLAR